MVSGTINAGSAGKEGDIVEPEVVSYSSRSIVAKRQHNAGGSGLCGQDKAIGMPPFVQRHSSCGVNLLSVYKERDIGLNEGSGGRVNYIGIAWRRSVIGAPAHINPVSR